MAWNPFIGWSQTDLETALEAAQNDLAAGKMTIGAGDGNVMVKNSIDARPEARIRLILLALYRIDPEKYPIEQITPVTTARVVFGTGIPDSGIPASGTIQNSISYSGPPHINPPYISAIVVDVDGRQWQFFGGDWH